MAPVPQFFQNPIRYLRYASHQFPALYWSVVIGGVSPFILVGVPYIRKKLGYENSPQVPLTYPLPNRPRVPLTGYDDDEE
ncbi:hypothetical protein BDZ91DRAFT_673944 [Kalaharituber pfeilii]|nr:hypothetical protein BDZ91DRAFT_673944 [Kalaharituber pfeilii]